MKKSIVGPNFTNFYSYSEGDTTIKLERTRNVHGGPIIYRDFIRFENETDAAIYFEDNCGA